MESRTQSLQGEQHVARVLDRLGDSALVTRREVRVLAGEDLTRVGGERFHGPGGRERYLGGSGSLLLVFGGAHGGKGGQTVNFEEGVSTRIFEMQTDTFSTHLPPDRCPRSSNG